MEKYTQTSIDISSCPEPKLSATAASADSPVPGKSSAIEQKELSAVRQTVKGGKRPLVAL